jgi:putative transposase
MMKNNILNLEYENLQIHELNQAIKDNRDKSMHVKYMVIYHHLKGIPNVDIAIMFNLCAHTVGTYVNKYKSKGLSALVPEPKSGAPKRLTEDQELKLKEVIAFNTPDNAGFPNRKNWDAGLAIQWVEKNFGVKYSRSGMLKILHRLDLSFTKPTYTLAKANPQKQQDFKDHFEVLKKAY